jgi:hypothetical protein
MLTDETTIASCSSGNCKLTPSWFTFQDLGDECSTAIHTGFIESIEAGFVRGRRAFLVGGWCSILAGYWLITKPNTFSILAFITVFLATCFCVFICEGARNVIFCNVRFRDPIRYGAHPRGRYKVAKYSPRAFGIFERFTIRANEYFRTRDHFKIKIEYVSRNGTEKAPATARPDIDCFLEG